MCLGQRINTLLKGLPAAVALLHVYILWLGGVFAIQQIVSIQIRGMQAVLIDNLAVYLGSNIVRIFKAVTQWLAKRHMHLPLLPAIPCPIEATSSCSPFS